MASVWNYVRSYTAKVILRKPDQELKDKLFKVHKTLGPLFAETDLSVEIAKGKALGSPEIPQVGELARIQKLTNTNKEELLKELGFG